MIYNLLIHFTRVHWVETCIQMLLNVHVVRIAFVKFLEVAKAIIYDISWFKDIATI